ncbi:MAG: hypothetical protein GVY17_10940 [Cyanobacteria bacterium]|nr:hypothetical protein [Cyanobacteria bacterium GSL.Bin21]
MPIKVVRKSTGEIGYGDEYPRSSDREPVRWYVQFPKDDTSIIFTDDDPNFEVTYLDESATVEELIELNRQLTSKKVDSE